MKKILSVLLVLAALLAMATSAALAAEIALVTDVGTIDDESFNQACWEGVKAYAEANGKTYQYYQPGADSTDERLNSIDLAVSEGAKVVVCPGYLFGETMAAVQDIYPDVSFIAVDVSAADLGTDAKENLYCAVFGEEQAGYLAGYAVVKDGYTKLGFLGGMAVPAVIRYGYGFVQGADAAAQELGTNIDINYFYGGQFYGDANITSRMEGWYSNGTQVVFACGGGIYTSAVDAAKKVGAKVIGVDVDQAGVIANYAGGDEYKELTVTSAMKGLYPATYDALTDIILNGKWADYVGKIETLGLVSGDDPEANYVQIPMESTQWSDSFTQEDYKALVAKMFAGEVTVSNDTTTVPAVTNTTLNMQDNIK